MLNGVPEGVPEVQFGTDAVLLRVLGNNPGLDGRRPPDVVLNAPLVLVLGRL